MSKPGIKFDGGKLRYSLIPPVALEQIATILTFGAEKYEPDNWQNIEDGIERYTDSMLRHIESWRDDKPVDRDSKMHHLAHAATCLSFILWFLNEDGRLPKFEDVSVQKRLAEVREEYALKRATAFMTGASRDKAIKNDS